MLLKRTSGIFGGAEAEGSVDNMEPSNVKLRESNGFVKSQLEIQNTCLFKSSPRIQIHPKERSQSFKFSYHQKHRSSLIVSIVLPLLFVLLLPRLRIVDRYQLDDMLIKSNSRFTCPEDNNNDVNSARVSSEFPIIATACNLVYTLIRLPFDRVRLESGLMQVTAIGTQIRPSKSDLQEEETQLMSVAPAEHRSAYMAPNPVHNHPYQGASGSEPSLPSQSSHEPQHQDAYGPSGLDSGQAPGQTGEEVGVSSDRPTAGISGSTGLQTRSDLPVVRALNVKCEKNHMTVNIVFDRPFYGLVFSKGHYNDQKCVHLPANSGQTSVNFDIHLGKCGMSSSDASGASIQGQSQQLQQSGSGQQPNGLYIENTIIIQYDPQVQEIFDQARKLRCTWYDYYEKSVTFRPYNVDMLDAVTANFLGDNIQCWMQIQVGKGPWSSEVAGIVKIGQTMTMVLAIKDDENRFDMLVRNCVAHDGKHQPIQLVDEYGCVARPKIMSRFQKVRDFGPAATVVSYAHFQAFKFPDSMSVHFQCVIQVCRYECPEPVCANQANGFVADSGNSNPPGDYTASGTELVASKESNPSYAFPNSALNSSSGSHATHALKLDESQGRVQVKLDTSMVTGSHLLGRNTASVSGLAPAHLLHATGNPSTPSAFNQLPPSSNLGHAYLSSSPYGQSGSKSTGGTAKFSQTASAQRTSPQAPSNQQSVHYSPPYPQLRRAAYATNRIGELAPESSDRPKTLLTNQHDLDAGVHPLSLIALPRGLRMASPTSTAPASTTQLPTAPNHRYRRMVSVKSAGDNHKRDQRSVMSPDSTDIRTQKSIQVVSPDDMAFSLLAEELAGPQVTMGTRGSVSNRYQLDHQDISSVCFSTARLMVVVMVTLGALLSSIVIAVYLIFRQRSNIEHKLSSVYEIPETSDYVKIHGHQPTNIEHRIEPESYLVGEEPAQHGIRNGAQFVTRRQEEEIRHRNSYLNRLYSQFAPVNYWG